MYLNQGLKKLVSKQTKFQFFNEMKSVKSAVEKLKVFLLATTAC